MSVLEELTVWQKAAIEDINMKELNVITENGNAELISKFVDALWAVDWLSGWIETDLEIYIEDLDYHTRGILYGIFNHIDVDYLFGDFDRDQFKEVVLALYGRESGGDGSQSTPSI